MPQAQTTLKGTVIAGQGPSQQIFHVHKAALERSPIIKGWIEDSSSIPESLREGDALCFAYVDPVVVSTVVRFLERDGRELSTFEFREASSEEEMSDPIFFVRVYKLAGSLAVEDLCIAALQKIQARKYSTNVFIEIVVEAERGKLIEGKRFRDWMVGYVRQNSEQLLESEIFRKAVEGGGPTGWAICSLMMKGLCDSSTESSAKSRGKVKLVRSEGGLPTPPASSEKGHPSFDLPKDRGTSYTKLYSQSPVSKTQSRATKKRNLNATVEDATPSDEEDSTSATIGDGIEDRSSKRSRV